MVRQGSKLWCDRDLQYNYSHDNDGPGLMVYTYAYASHADQGCVVRFNVSDNDSRRSRTYAGLWVRSDGNGITSLKVYNNTVRIGAWSAQAAFVDGNGVEAEFKNNILVGCDGALPLLVEHPNNNLRFHNNLYWGGGAPFGIQWGNQTYGSLAEWQHKAGQESLDGRLLGQFADPGISGNSGENPGSAGNWQKLLIAYKPRRTSPVFLQGTAMGGDPLRADHRSDILGNVLEVERWPIGAVAYGSP